MDLSIYRVIFGMARQPEECPHTNHCHPPTNHCHSPIQRVGCGRPVSQPFSAVFRWAWRAWRSAGLTREWQRFVWEAGSDLYGRGPNTREGERSGARRTPPYKSLPLSHTNHCHQGPIQRTATRSLRVQITARQITATLPYKSLPPSHTNITGRSRCVFRSPHFGLS